MSNKSFDFFSNVLEPDGTRAWWNQSFFLIEEPLIALSIPSPALTVPFPDNKLPNKDAPKEPNSIDKKPPFCFFLFPF